MVAETEHAVISLLAAHAIINAFTIFVIGLLLLINKINRDEKNN
ncbi:unnamed protein product [marine sediment metagenome]|uniref:Uncharacterized protein n=1 Tax=marine sediment metagenome TaxID=412755 RepID=X0WFW2_9ZZZZ